MIAPDEHQPQRAPRFRPHDLGGDVLNIPLEAFAG